MNFNGLKKKLKKMTGMQVEEINTRYYSRFNKYSFKGNKCNCEQQYEAVITRWYHTIEKGLAYVNYRPGFGRKNIASLLESMENYVSDGYDVNTFFFQTALSTLHAYISKNRQYDVSDLELENRVKALGGAPNSCGGAVSFVPASAEDVRKMNYKDFVLSRRSLRHFSSQDVDLETIESALKLAQHTPSACNRQGWRTIIISNKSLMNEVLHNQNGNEGFGQEFNKLLLIVSDIRYFNGDRELYQPFVDGGMYAQSVLNALHFEHIASVPLSASLTPQQEDNVRRALKLDDAEMPILFIGIGHYPDICQSTSSERRPDTNMKVLS